jgi:hypothetical protein
MASSQLHSIANFILTAITSARPQGSPAFIAADMFEYEQSTKTLTSDINEFGHGDLRQGCRIKWRPGAETLGRCG